MKIFTFIFTILFSVNIAFASSFETVVLPNEVTGEMHLSPSDDLIKGKVWNRWTTENFVVCSLSNSQGKYLHDHLGEIKQWIYHRWGLYDVDFSVNCKLICVNDKNLFNKLFRLERTRVEVRRDANGKIKETVVFLLLDKSASKTVPMPLTEVCLAEFEQKYGVRFGWWVHRGMSMLNGTIPNIRREITIQGKYLGNPEQNSRTIMEITESQYKKLSYEQRRLYDGAAMMLCLLYKKEFGTTKFQQMMQETSKGKSPEKAVQQVLGFRNYEHLDQSFDRYIGDLHEDVKDNKTPDSYLQIKVL